MPRPLGLAVLAGVLQGVLEWLPVSSEGNVAIVLTLFGFAPGAAVDLSLFLHVGTALSAAVYYRSELIAAVASLPDWRPADAFRAETADLSFLGVATVASALTGFAAYLALDRVVSSLTGGAFVALIGALLIATGAVQRFASGGAGGERHDPDLVDAVVVGGLQGLAILPGVSRSGTTASALLLRGHDGPGAFRLSFLLSVPAALGAGALVVLETGGLPSLTLPVALVALATAAVVGYVTIDLLMRVVRRVEFWLVCVGFGAVAVVGGVLLQLL